MLQLGSACFMTRADILVKLVSVAKGAAAAVKHVFHHSSWGYLVLCVSTTSDGDAVEEGFLSELSGGLL